MSYDFARRLREQILRNQQEKSRDIPLFLAQLFFGLSVLGFIIVIIRAMLR